MDDTSGFNKRGRLIGLGIVALLVVLIIVSGSPARFLNWILSLLAAFSLVLLFLFVFALVVVVISAVLHRYIERRRQETELPDQQLPQPRMRRVQYTSRREPRRSSNDDWEDNDY